VVTKYLVSVFVGLAGLLCVSVPTAWTAACTTTLNPGANIVSAISSASAGAVICLNNGSYAYQDIANITKTNYVTVRSTNTRGATINGIQLWNSKYVRIEDVNLNGLDVMECSQHIQVVNVTITDAITIRGESCGSTYNWDLLFDQLTMNNVPQGTWPCMIGIYTASSTSGIIISNSVFTGGSSCSDGICTLGGTGGVLIGVGNSFTDFVQGSCGNHVDVFQDNGGGGPNTIAGNYFKNNTVNVGIYDGGQGYQILNNAFNSSNSLGYQSLQIGDMAGMLIEHNTFHDILSSFGSKSGGSNTGWIIRNNIWVNSAIVDGSQVQDHCGSGCVVSYNLHDSASTNVNGWGSNDLTGTPTWTGGASPTTWAGFLLTSSSLGYKNASDGYNRGVYTLVAGDFAVFQNFESSGGATPPVGVVTLTVRSLLPWIIPIAIAVSLLTAGCAMAYRQQKRTARHVISPDDPTHPVEQPRQPVPVDGPAAASLHQAQRVVDSPQCAPDAELVVAGVHRGPAENHRG
jgi:hypothetical protein